MIRIVPAPCPCENLTVTDPELDALRDLAAGLEGMPADRVLARMSRIETAIADLMEATFREQDQKRKPRHARVEMKLRQVRERALASRWN